MYMASGYVASKNGNELYLYSSGQPFTHGGNHKTVWGTNLGIRMLTLRKDGFVSLDAPYDFSVPAPSFTTVALEVPSDCPSSVLKDVAVGSVELLANAQVNVAGYLQAEVLVKTKEGQWAVAAGFAMKDADAMKGNSVAARLSWSKSGQHFLSKFAGQQIKLHIAMVDVKLFSLRLACSTDHKKAPKSLMI